MMGMDDKDRHQTAIDSYYERQGRAKTNGLAAYRQSDRNDPDNPDKPDDGPLKDGSVFSDLAARAKVKPERVALGGRSMGGRMCSMAVAEGLPAAALVLISYPLHPPGKPERLRTEHFEALSLPCLFLSGTRDAFGTPDELLAATAGIPGPVTHEWIDGGSHGLRGADARVADVVRRWISIARP
jgi:predicted alpha/beta-hydrolase family hydrolase